MNFNLTVLGTASAMPVTGRYQSAQVLSVRGRFFLIDCGEGIQRRLIENHISMMKIDSIFISHIHGDHVFGLPGLLSTMGLSARVKPLVIYAPSNFAPLLKFFMSYYGDGIGYEVKHVPLTMKSPETIFQTKSLEISAFPLNHGIDTYGFIFKEKEPQFNVRKEKIDEYALTRADIGTLKRGEDVERINPDGTVTVLPLSELAYRPYSPRSYAYCSDTAPFKEEAEWVHGVDLLYHETTYLKENAGHAKQRHHSTTLDAARCAVDAQAKKLVIGHYSSRVKDVALYQKECRGIFPETYAASDGSTFDVPMEKFE